MRWFIGGMVILGLVAACSVPSFEELGLACDADEDCGPKGLCDAVDGQRLCRRKPDVVAPNLCTPACLAAETCTTEGCQRRFSAVKIREPADGASLNGGTIPISAELIEQYVTEAEWPTLVFTATRGDGSPAGSIPTPTRSGNTYTALWTVPNLDEQVTVTAAYAEANLRDTVTVDVDTVPPTLSIAFSGPPTRSPGSAGVQAEQKDPQAEYVGAFRRDEPVTVTVSSSDDTVTQAQLTVTGIGSGGGPGRVEAPVTVELQRRTSCPGSQPVCGEKTVDLSALEMSAFRGTMLFRAKGQDRAGNEGQTAEVPLRVTRWKWAFDTAGRIEATPAVGHQGSLYFGTSTGSQGGKVFAVDGAGAKKWTVDSVDVIGSPAVGDITNNDEYVYVSAKSQGGPVLYALKGSGGVKASCSRAANFEGPSAIAVGRVGGLETAVTIYNSTSQAGIARIRPDAASSAECLDLVASTIPRGISGAVVMKDQNIFYGTNDGAVTSYDLSAEAKRTGWPQSFSVGVPGLAIVGEQVLASAGTAGAATLGGLSKISVEGGAAAPLYPETGSARVFNFAIGSGETAYFGAENTVSQDLYALPLAPGASATMIASGVGTLRGAPVMGRGGNFYTVNTAGNVRAWAPNVPTATWQVDLAQGAGEATNISPTLDCLREPSGQAVAGSRLGVLYVTAATKVHAFIVDSPGLDPDAPWPKYQHDARNTGNPATPITRCP